MTSVTKTRRIFASPHWRGRRFFLNILSQVVNAA